ncbi:MAG: ABC transporter ATP-binding protein [Bacteroides sp.]|nr:ABC transporter ATP-binding protein [Eubacterium sp.]MCM1417674.1 ABC transporter ATP-binding protein [Roseburia sp.]MCM1461860.1 ABC transporter ATP-binding protein [Bacteroides sp.]
MTTLEIRGLCKDFDGNRVLRDVGFRVEAGDFVAVMGRSGCGKSTLLYCVSGMDDPTAGTVELDGRALSALSAKETERLRLTRMGFIFQKANLLKTLTIAENITFPAFQLGRETRGAILARAEELMKKTDILSVADSDIRRVSGGQLQRAAICRAMMNRPELLFGDEPTGALNSSATREVMDILTAIHREGTTVLLVTHDAKVAARADRVIYLEDGGIKDELRSGRYSEKDLPRREDALREWLSVIGF